MCFSGSHLFCYAVGPNAKISLSNKSKQTVRNQRVGITDLNKNSATCLLHRYSHLVSCGVGPSRALHRCTTETHHWVDIELEHVQGQLLGCLDRTGRSMGGRMSLGGCDAHALLVDELLLPRAVLGRLIQTLASLQVARNRTAFARCPHGC